MATSGNYTTGTKYSGDGDSSYARSLRFEWSRVSYSVTDLTSTISWTLKTGSDGSSGTYVYLQSYNLKINGTSVKSSSSSIKAYGNGSTTLATGTTKIKHSNAGTATFTVDMSGAFYTSSTNCSGSHTFTLDNLAVKSDITSATNVTLGNACSVTWTPKNSAYGYKLKFSIGDWSYTTSALAPNRTTAYTYSSYTMAVGTIAPYITGAKTATCTATLTTYTTSACTTVVGSTTKTFTVTVPSLPPNIKSHTIKDLDSTAKDFGLYVKTKSYLQVDTDAEGQYGASISSIDTSITGFVNSYNGASIVSGYLNSSGSVSVTTIVTDSRGYTNTITKNINVTDYSDPTVSLFKVYRSDASGNFLNSGTSLTINYSYSISSLGNKNKKNVTLQYYNGSSWSTLATLTEYSANNTKRTFTTPIFYTQTNYQIKMILTDSFSTSEQKSVLFAAFKLVDFYNTGKGLSVGKFAEEDELFDVNLDTKFRKNIKKVDSDGNDLVSIESDKANLNLPVIFKKNFIMVDENENMSNVTIDNGIIFVNGNAINDDTGWLDLSIETSKFNLYNTEVTCKYRKKNGIVNVIGELSPKSGGQINATSSTFRTMFNLPEGFRPVIDSISVCQGSGTCVWTLRIDTNGTGRIERYRNGSTYSDLSTQTWLPFNVTFIAG